MNEGYDAALFFPPPVAERVALYRRAADLAKTYGLPTISIRLSLARVLLDTGEPGAALVELLACEGELGEGDESERASWAELIEETRRAREGRALTDLPSPGAPPRPGRDSSFPAS